MIIILILNLLVSFLVVILSPLPSVTVLPFGIDAELTTAMGYFNSFLDLVWPLQIIWQCLLWYLGFELVLLVIRVFLPHRLPRLGNEL